MDIKIILTHYLVCALWSSIDDNDEPFDSNYDINDIDQESWDKSEKEITSFVEKAGNLLDNIEDEQIGHDIWLTRNHHGAGFWDRGYEKSIGDGLTKIAHDLGERNVFLNDNGKLSIE